MFDHYQDIFNERNESPLWWYNKSSDLHASAGALWIAISDNKEKKYQNSLSLGSGFSMGVACWPVYQMLFGLSLELIFKAIHVAANNPLKHTHNLVALAESIDLQFTKKETDVFCLLTESIIWEGKYPVPKKTGSLENHYKKSNKVLFNSHKVGNLEIKTSNGTLDWENLNSLWRKIAKEFNKSYK